MTVSPQRLSTTAFGLRSGRAELVGRLTNARPERSAKRVVEGRWGQALITVLSLLLCAPALADSNQPAAPYAYRQLEDPRQEARAKALMEELRCLVCQGQSIADSDAELAGDMRSLVRERIKAGESPNQIREWLVQRYGSWVSYQPVLGPDTLLLYGAPLVLLLIGGLMAARRLKRRPRRSEGSL